MTILAIAFLCGCSGHRDPRAAFDRAWNTFRHGDLQRAEKEAKEGYDDFHGSSPEYAWKFTILRARILYARGRYEEVLRLLSSEHTVLPPGELVVQKYRFEGMAYTSLRLFPEAERSFGDAERVCASANYEPCADVLNARGMLQMARGNYAQGQGFFERVLTFAHVSGDAVWEAETLLNLSWAADEQTHYDEALDWAGSAANISLSRGAPDISQKALGNMGWAYYKLGDLEKAEGMFVEAKDQAERIGEIASEAGWLTDAGYAYMDSGDPPHAEGSFQQSLALARKIKSPEDIMDSLTALSFVLEQTGKFDDAKRYADEALAMARVSGNAEDVVYPLLVEGRLAARQHDTAAAQAAFQQVAQSSDTPVFLKWEAERSLARLYEDENHPDSADREYRTALSTFEGARCGLHERVDSRLPFLSNAARIYEDYIHFLVARGRTNDALQVADYTRARTLAEGLGRACKPTFAPDPLNAPEIARRAGGTILFYALGQEHSYLWAITPHQAKIFPLTANQSEIDAAVQSYRKKLEGPPEILEASNDGSMLYQMLVEPAQDFLKKEAEGSGSVRSKGSCGAREIPRPAGENAGLRNDALQLCAESKVKLTHYRAAAKNSHVFIIPDGGLNSLNFETLLPQPKRYWIEDVTVVNAASLRLLPASRGNHGNLAGELLVVGNPVAPDAGPDNPYPELPNAAAQMENIEKYFPGERQNVFARQQASPAAYLSSQPDRFSYIHFVAHGTASRMNPLDSAIILSREPASNAATGQDDSFKLYARDIITHPLRAQLVTISACYSTGKRTYSGEGLVGLSWAFLRAGAHNVIGALWEVSDASTARLMDRLYDEMKRGQPPDAALRSAKLSLLHSEDAVHRPFYWAPFQLYTGQ